MTKDDIFKANSLIKTTDVKGKAYAEVNQRIKAFRSICPNGSIKTEILSLEAGVCTMKAIILDEEGKVLGVGHAQEKEGSSFINKTSFIENAETSCVGRALGMCGIGIDTSIASAEEVLNAIANQNKKEERSDIENSKITSADVKALRTVIKKAGVSEVSLLEFYNVKEFSELTFLQLSEALKKLDAMISQKTI